MFYYIEKEICCCKSLKGLESSGTKICYEWTYGTQVMEMGSEIIDA